jgi:ABC-type antimicrobial peptide transport system permease subunit
MVLVGASGAVGILLSIFALRILARFLAASTDAQVYVPVVALLAAITLVACAIPARRALRIHPSDALRQE